jgi:para-aminobenzoate synthetase/4-amino-4-deoxychorismate lyase
MKQEPLVILESFSPDRDSASHIFTDMVEEIDAPSLDDIPNALARIEQQVAAGLHAAGFISYEAAPAINPDLAAYPPGRQPLLWFGIFRKRLPISAEAVAGRGYYHLGKWEPELDQESHSGAVGAILDLIAAGETYQVNLTMRLRTTLQGEAFACYRDLCRAQRPAFSAYFDIGSWQILSASPELFFSLKEGVLTARPMKGTIPRGRWSEEDREAQEAMRNSPKERAENLMIVDLIRNDLGMIAETGTVRVESLFDIETLPTLHQMTSTVTARLNKEAGVTDILKALFPCGSVTGAPKRRTMEIIRDLELSPRGVYTGCIGYISPGESAKSMEAVFSVAIRTMVVESQSGAVELGVGSGITWDSDATSEYIESLAKGKFTRSPSPEFRLIETIIHREGSGYYLLQRHLERLKRSAAYFGFCLEIDKAGEALQKLAANLTGCTKVRLLLDRGGNMEISSEEIAPAPDGKTDKVAFSTVAIDSGDLFRYHKTTCRDLYQRELSRHPGCIDIIFCNERGELCEGANHNLVVKINGRLVTPPVHCGLLPGVMREELLANGEIAEQVIPRGELSHAEEIWLINSVRGWRQVSLVQ